MHEVHPSRSVDSFKLLLTSESYLAIVDRLWNSAKPQVGNTCLTCAKNSYTCESSVKVEPDDRPERSGMTDQKGSLNTEGSVNLTLPMELCTKQDRGGATIDSLVTVSQPLQTGVSSPTKDLLDHCVTTPEVSSCPAVLTRDPHDLKCHLGEICHREQPGISALPDIEEELY